MTRRSASVTTALLSLLLLLVVWQVAATTVDMRSLPAPIAVWQALVTEFKSGELLTHLSATLLRVIAAFIVAMVIGSCVGILLGMRDSLNQFFDPWIVLLLNIPALVIIVLAYIWFGLTEAAAIGAVAVNKIPNVVVTRSNGVGFQIHLYFQLFDVATILAYTLSFVVIMLLVEYLILQPLDKSATRWRPARA